MKIQGRPACDVAFQHATPFGLRSSAFPASASLYRARGTTACTVRFDARGEATGRLAEVLTSRPQGGVLTS